METAKLTLRPTRMVVELAHQLAKEDNTSITQMFSAFILSRRQQKEKTKSIPLGPLTRAATGLVKGHPDYDYKEELADILEEKYGR